ncbi:DUF4286 family protein [Lysobacter antibioticus]|uniref:DUF4286 family protein n=1 Tax=Lysobacter antibioticus TaxID=84531 RepID=UPI00034C60B1|nr:DUF4286 family protein [Lysobacter antibioticus]
MADRDATTGAGEADASRAETTYEVSLEVDAAIEAEYLAWLRAHIDEICALPGFLGARLHRVEDPAPAAGRFGLCVQYRLRDRAALDDYLREHAPRLRGDGVARFGGRFDASRRILRRLA